MTAAYDEHQILVDSGHSMDEELLDDAPVRLYERLRQIEGYTWDESRLAYHSSYNNWYALNFLL